MITNGMAAEYLSGKLSMSLDEAKKLLYMIPEVMKKYAVELDSVAIPGFGTFAPEKKNEQIVDNNETGNKTMLPPVISVNFKSSVVLRKRLLG